MGSMLEEAERLSRITEMLLAMSRLDSGESKIREERVDLAALAGIRRSRCAAGR